MRNDLYWQDRFVQLKERLLDKSIDYYHNVSNQYNKAAANVQKEIDVFYQRFAKNNEMDLTDAKKLLNAKELKEFKWTVDEYIEKGKTLNYTNEWTKQLENASLRYRISRLEALQLQMQQQVESVMGYEVDELDNMTRKIYEDGYYHSIFELQKGNGFGSSFAILDTDTINKVIAKPWTSDGTNFSERVWGQHRPALIQSLNTDLVQALIRGDNPQNLTDKIAKEFNVAKSKANRLLYTEAAFFSEASQKDAFDELGVKYFSICATLDKDTCEDCGGREGEKIPMSMYEVGVTAPPFHPNCRCTTLPEEDAETNNKSYRMARDEDGKNYEVPNNMTYQQWKSKYVDNGQELVIDEPNLTKSKKDNIINKNMSEQGEKLKQACEKSGVKYIAPQEFKIQPTTDEIIERLSGGDKTKGSCSSLAFAYAGNKAGLDVLDFRGGNSWYIFSSNMYIIDITKLPGIESYFIEHTNDFKAVSELLEKVVEGKEYYLVTGRHAAIIRKNKLNYEYLELQSANKKDNVFKVLDNESLKKRFRCCRSRTVFGTKMESRNILIEIDSLGKSDDFRALLGYINTEKGKQKKGVDGYVK